MEVKGGKAEFTKEESEEWGARVKEDILQKRKVVEEEEKRGAQAAA